MQRFFSVAVSAVVLAISSTNAQQQMDDDVQTWAKVFDNNTVTTGLDGS